MYSFWDWRINWYECKLEEVPLLKCNVKNMNVSDMKTSDRSILIMANFSQLKDPWRFWHSLPGQNICSWKTSIKPEHWLIEWIRVELQSTEDLLRKIIFELSTNLTILENCALEWLLCLDVQNPFAKLEGPSSFISLSLIIWYKSIFPLKKNLVSI